MPIHSPVGLAHPSTAFPGFPPGIDQFAPYGFNPRKRWFIAQDFSAGGDRNLVFPAQFGNGGTALLSPIDNEMCAMRGETAAVASGDGIMAVLGGPNDSVAIDFDVGTLLLFRSVMNQTAARRYWVGLTNTTNNGIPPVATIQQVGFVLDAATPTNFRIRHGDTVGVVEVDYSPAVAQDIAFHNFWFWRNSATSIFLQMDDKAPMERTTSLPTVSVALAVGVGVLTTELVLKNDDWSYVYGWRSGMSR